MRNNNTAMCTLYQQSSVFIVLAGLIQVYIELPGIVCCQDYHLCSVKSECLAYESMSVLWAPVSIALWHHHFTEWVRFWSLYFRTIRLQLLIFRSDRTSLRTEFFISVSLRGREPLFLSHMSSTSSHLLTPYVSDSAHLSCERLWLKVSKPVTCPFLDIELEAQIGEKGFRVCNSSIQLVSLNLS